MVVGWKGCGGCGDVWMGGRESKNISIVLSTLLGPALRLSTETGSLPTKCSVNNYKNEINLNDKKR